MRSGSCNTLFLFLKTYAALKEGNACKVFGEG